MRERHHQDGVTLVELMVVVAILGVLASLATYLFARQTRRARASEVAAMFGELKLREENFYLENDQYLSTGEDDSDYYPSASPPGSSPQSFDLTESAAPPSPQDEKWPGPAWRTLKVNPGPSELYCVYVAIAGRAGDDTNVGSQASAEPFGLGGTDLPVPASDWYYLMAECDLDGDGTPSRYFTLSDTEKTIVENRGE